MMQFTTFCVAGAAMLLITVPRTAALKSSVHAFAAHEIHHEGSKKSGPTLQEQVEETLHTIYEKTHPAHSSSKVSCLGTLGMMTASKSPTIAKMALASGSSVPLDAGKYEMCLTIPRSRYFLTSMKVAVPEGMMDFTEIAKGLVSADNVPVMLGLCLPDVCFKEDIDSVVRMLGPTLVPMFRFAKPTSEQITATSPDLDLKLPGMDTVVTLCAILLLAGAALYATIVHLHQEPPLVAADGTLVQPPASAFVKIFSLLGKTGTFTKLTEAPPRGHFDCLNSMKVLSTWWIIMAHTVLHQKYIQGSWSNPQDQYPLDRTVPVVVGELSIVGAQAAVDTFFCISGILLTSAMIKELESGKFKLNMIPVGVVKRYMRLTPCLIFVYLLYHRVLPYLGRGPFAVRLQEHILPHCDVSWGNMFLYIQNFVDQEHMCMKWSWYLPLDMMFFAAGMVLLPLYMWKKWVLWALLVVISIVSCGYGTHLSNYWKLDIFNSLDFTSTVAWAQVYINPVVRIPAFLVGIGAGLIQDEMTKRGLGRTSRPTTTWGKLWPSCTLNLFIGLLGVIIMIPMTNIVGEGAGGWTQEDKTLYMIYSRPAWAVCCSVIILMCSNGYLPLLDDFLSHPAWVPLARLSFSAYLIHPVVIKLKAGHSLQFLSFCGWEVVTQTWANITYAFIGSAMVWCLVERPMMTVATLTSGPPKVQKAPALPSKAMEEALQVPSKV